MRLKSLTLEQFRSYEHLHLDFTEPRTLIIGENGVGKSTIPDAIALVLTGRCRGVNRKGEGQKELIRGTATEARITLDIDGLGPVTRTINFRGAQTTVPVDTILGALGTTDGFLTAAIYGSTFFDLDHAEAKALLQRLLNVTVKVQARTPTADDDGVDVLTMDEADLRYKAAYENRTVLNRTLKNLHVPAVTRRVDLEGIDTDELAERMRDARSSYEAAVAATADVRATGRTLEDQRKKLTAATVEVSGLEGKRDAHRDMLAEHQGDLTAARTDLATAEAMPAEPVDSLPGQISELRLFTQRIESTAPALTLTPAPAKGKVKKAAAAPAPAGPAVCVLGAGIPCMTPPAEFQAALNVTKKQIDALEARLKAGTKRAEAIAQAAQRVKTAERNVDYTERQITTVQAQIDAELARREELARVEAELAAVAPEVEQGQKAVDEAAGALAKLQATANDLAAYQRALDVQEAEQLRLEDIKAELADCERLVADLGPRGIRATALQGAVADFESAINAALAGFGFSLAITVDPWVVRVQHPQTPRPLPFELLSKGQKLWTGLAFQLALAAISGLDFAVVDDAEGVVGQARALLTELVLGAPVGQVLMVKAQASSDPVPAIDGLQVVAIQANALAVA